jgi:hypothetical protein
MNNECLDALIHYNEINVLQFHGIKIDHDESNLINA